MDTSQTGGSDRRKPTFLDVDASARLAASVDPALVLAGDRPRLIDEWQLEPAVWNRVRREVDEHPDAPGQFNPHRVGSPRR